MSIKSGQKENPLQKFLEEQDIGIREFSRLASIPKSTIHDIVTGHSTPGKKVATKICKAARFSITLEDFGLQ